MTRPGVKRRFEGFSGAWRRFRGDCAGVAAIEAAMVLPLLGLAYVGLVNVSQMVMINRKVTHLTSALSDLTSRLQTIPTTEITNIFKAGETILLPYDSSKAKMVIASIVIDANLVAKVCWASSYPAGTPAPKRGDTVTVPQSARVANTSVIMAQASYEYKPLIGKGIFDFISPGTLGGEPIYTRPRSGKAAGDNNIEQIVRGDVAGCPKFN